MKCRQCSKDIPNGFTDCPWCGAKAGASPSTIPLESPGPPTQSLLIAISCVTSGLLFLVLTYFGTIRSSGPLSIETSGYFLVRLFGAALLGFLLVWGFCKLRSATLRGPVQGLLVLTFASLFALLALAIPTRTRLKGIDAATVRRYSDVVKPKTPKTPPVNKTKWDPAGRSLMQDVQARNQQYLAEISTLDETAKPLYTPESFQTPRAIQQTIDQLHARLSVADKYTDWQPIFSKMNVYVAAVDATDDEKHKFLQSFHTTLPKTLAVCKIISDKEHAWLQSSLDLYQFALAKEGQFLWQPDNLLFKQHADSDAFRQKFIKARTLNTQFLQAYWQVRQSEEAMMVQLGLQDADADPNQPPANPNR